MLARANSVISENYRMIGNDSLSEFHGKKYLEIATKMSDDAMILDATLKLCVLYSQMKKEDKLQELVDKALKMAIAQKSEESIAQILEIKATRQADQKDYKEAAENYGRVLSVWEKKKNYAAVAWIQANLSNVFCELNKKDSASYYASAALKTSKGNILKKEMTDAYHALFNYNQKFGDFKKALEYLLIYDSLYNSTYNSEMAKNAERTRMEYDQGKKILGGQLRLALATADMSGRMRAILEHSPVGVVLQDGSGLAPS